MTQAQPVYLRPKRSGRSIGHIPTAQFFGGATWTYCGRLVSAENYEMTEGVPAELCQICAAAAKGTEEEGRQA